VLAVELDGLFENLDVGQVIQVDGFGKVLPFTLLGI
jgi:hypothetical protein